MSSTVICMSCSSTGTNKQIQMVPCSSCQGKGCINTGFAIGTCGHCHGMGIVPERIENPCPLCHGSGSLNI
jgi:DnaJ-class molecular chaperone